MPVVIVPPPFQGPTRGEGLVVVEATTVRSALAAVEERFPGFASQVFDDAGNLHHFAKVFCDGEAVDESGVDASLGGDAEIEVVAAIAGG